MLNEAIVIKTLKKQVEMVLKSYPETRNSDIALTIRVWKMFYDVRDQIFLNQLYDLPNQDNVKRVRAKFNSEGKYYPTSLEVAKKRKLNEVIWRREMGYHVQAEGQEVMF